MAGRRPGGSAPPKKRFNMVEVLQEEHSRLMTEKLTYLENIAGQLHELKSLLSRVESFESDLSLFMRNNHFYSDSHRTELSRGLADEWRKIVSGVQSANIVADDHMDEVKGSSADTSAMSAVHVSDDAADSKPLPSRLTVSEMIPDSAMGLVPTPATIPASSSISRERSGSQSASRSESASSVSLSSVSQLQKELAVLRQSKLELVQSTSVEIDKLTNSIKSKVSAISKLLSDKSRAMKKKKKRRLVKPRSALFSSLTSFSFLIGGGPTASSAAAAGGVPSSSAAASGRRTRSSSSTLISSSLKSIPEDGSTSDSGNGFSGFGRRWWQKLLFGGGSAMGGPGSASGTGSDIRIKSDYRLTESSLKTCERIRQLRARSKNGEGSVKYRDVLLAGTEYSGKSCLRNHMALVLSERVSSFAAAQSAAVTTTSSLKYSKLLSQSMRRMESVLGLNFAGLTADSELMMWNARDSEQNAMHTARLIISYCIIKPTSNLLKKHDYFRKFPDSLISDGDLDDPEHMIGDDEDFGPSLGIGDLTLSAAAVEEEEEMKYGDRMMEIEDELSVPLAVSDIAGSASFGSDSTPIIIGAAGSTVAAHSGGIHLPISSTADDPITGATIASHSRFQSSKRRVPRVRQCLMIWQSKQCELYNELYLNREMYELLTDIWDLSTHIRNALINAFGHLFDIEFFFDNLEKYCQRNWYVVSSVGSSISRAKTLHSSALSSSSIIQGTSSAVTTNMNAMMDLSYSESASRDRSGTGMTMYTDGPAEETGVNIEEILRMCRYTLPPRRELVSSSSMLLSKSDGGGWVRTGVIDIEHKKTGKVLPVASYLEMPVMMAVNEDGVSSDVLIEKDDEKKDAHLHSDRMVKGEVWRVWELHCSMSSAVSEDYLRMDAKEIRSVFFTRSMIEFDCFVYCLPSVFSLKMDRFATETTRFNVSLDLLDELQNLLMFQSELLSSKDGSDVTDTSPANPPPTIVFTNKLDLFQRSLDAAFILGFPDFDGELRYDVCLEFIRQKIQSLNEIRSRPFHVYNSDFLDTEQVRKVIHHIQTMCDLSRK